MPSAQLVSLGVGPSPDQVAQSLMSLVGDPDGREVAAAQKASEKEGVAAVVLDPVAAGSRGEGGSNHLGLNSQPRQLPMKGIAGGPRFVRGDQPNAGTFQRFHQTADRSGLVPDGRVYLRLGTLVGDRHRDGFLVDIQTEKTSTLRQRTDLHTCWLYEGASRRSSQSTILCRERRSFHVD